MIVREAADLPVAKVGATQLPGREIVAPSDLVGFTFYDVDVPAGVIVQLTPNPSAQYNHIYYFISGQGTVVLPDNKVINIEDNLLVALTGKMAAELKAATNVRFCSLYVKASDDDTQPSEPLVIRMSEITGTDRDIDFGQGHSQRFLRRDDGFNISLHNTSINANTAIKLAYLNHFELGYYIIGDLTYAWDDLQVTHNFNQQVCEEGKGCAFLMNQHDAHEFRSFSRECMGICVFSPALVGDENHHFTDDGYSGY